MLLSLCTSPPPAKRGSVPQRWAHTTGTAKANRHLSPDGNDPSYRHAIMLQLERQHVKLVP